MTGTPANSEPHLQLHDPVFRAMESLVKLTKDTIELVLSGLRSAGRNGDPTDYSWLIYTLGQSGRRLSTFSNSVATLTRDGGALERMVDDFDEFDIQFEEAEELIANGLSSLRWDEASYGLVRLRGSFDSLSTEVKRLKPAHLTIQRHFQGLIFGGRGDGWPRSGEYDSFFMPLAKLRDEYFVTTSAKALTTYLALAEIVTPQVVYADMEEVPDYAREELKRLNEATEACAVELETVALMTMLESEL